MGDLNLNAANATNPLSTATTDDAPNSSIQILKETAELSDITKMGKPQPERHPQDSEMKIELADESKRGSTSIETVYENVGIDKTISSVTPSKTNTVGMEQAPSEMSNSQMSANSGRMNKLRDQASNIFPAGIMGCRENNDLPSPRRLLDAGEASADSIGHIDHTTRKLSIRNDYGRNPVLGTGLNDDEKLCGTRKSGSKSAGASPGAGEGEYETKVTPGSNSRIPPGGYSHGLW